MPSAKDPASIQPGPGTAPGGSVTASSLNFSPSLHSAPISAHINDPFEAHRASAISAGPYGGAAPWAIPAGSVDSALVEVFSGLNARSALVLDASPGALDADYAGPNAFVNAVTALGASLPRATLYLRPGQYSWDNSAILSGLTIIGGGSPTNSASTSYVEIVSSGNANHFRFAHGCSVRNVVLTAGAAGSVFLDLPVASGGCVFENVHFKLPGRYLYVSSSRNVFRQCTTHATAVNETFLIDGGGYNLYEACRFGQVSLTTSSGNGGNNVLNGVRIGSTTLSPLASSPMLRVESPGNVLAGTTIGHTGSVTMQEVRIASSYNTFRGLNVDGFSTSVEALLIVSGTNNSFDSVAFLNGTACTGQTNSALARLLGSDSAISNLRTASCQVGTGAGNAVVRLEGNQNTVGNLTVDSTTTGAAQILNFAGLGNKVIGANVMSVARDYTVVFGATARTSAFANATVGGFAVASTAISVLHVGGTGNIVSNIEMPNLSGMRGVRVVWLGGVGCKVSAVRITGAANASGSTTHVTFNVLRFEGATNCLAENIELRDSAGLYTVDDEDLAGLVSFDNAKGCTLDGLLLANVGTPVTALVGGLVYATGSAAAKNQQCVVRNVSVDSSTRLRGHGLLRCEQALWDGVTFDNVRLDVVNNGPMVSIWGYGSSPSLPCRFVDCAFSNTPTGTTGTFGLNVSGNPRFAFTGCSLSASAGQYVVYIVDEDFSTWQRWNSSFRECSFSAGGTGATVVVHCRANVKFSGCLFAGSTVTGAGGSVGVQLFSGSGAVALNGSSRYSALTLEDCTMLLGYRNFDPTGSALNPLVFFGGAGAVPTTNHGPIMIRGLKIQRNPLSTTVASWHRGQTLCIDTLNEVAGSTSVYQDIVLDMEGLPFVTTGYDVGPPFRVLTTLAPIATRFQSAVIEISGPEQASGGKSLISGLKVLRISRVGGGPGSPSPGGSVRSIIMARGVTLRELTLDGAAGAMGTSEGYTAAALAVDNCSVEGLDMWPTTSIPVYKSTTIGNELGAYIDAQRSELSDVRICNLQAANEASHLLWLENSTFRNSTVELPFGARFAGAFIVATASTIANNQISFDIHAATANDPVVVLLQSQDVGNRTNPCRLLNNLLENRAVQTAGFGYGVGPSSRGGGIQIQIDGSWTEVIGNRIMLHWNTGPAIKYNIQRNSGVYLRVVNNSVSNHAVATVAVGGADPGGGGTAGIYVGAGSGSSSKMFTTVAGNTMNAANTTTGTVRIDMSGNDASSVALGNVLVVADSPGVVVGQIGSTASSNKPAVPGDFNVLS